MRSGRRRTLTCRPSSRACSRRSATSPRPRSASLRHWRRASAIPRRLHRRRYPHGLLSGGQPCKPCHLRAFGRRGSGAEFTKLTTATLRAVAQGVIGVAFIQAIIVGLCLLLSDIPWAGVLAMIVLVLGIAQVPALLVTLAAIGYIWWTGDYGGSGGDRLLRADLRRGNGRQHSQAVMLGRGFDAPMPIILLGALGAMTVAGILGMFVGATLLA